MKKIITLAALLATGTAFANAATITWTGEAGDNAYETASNWSTNSVPQTGDTVVIGNNATVNQSTRMDWWEMNVTITNGATLNCTDSVAKWQNGTVTVENGGKLIIADNGEDMNLNCQGSLTINCKSKDGIQINDHLKIINSGANPTTVNFGKEGSMSVNEIWNGAWTINAVLQLENGADIANATAYRLVTREFFKLDHNTGNNIFGLSIVSSTVTGSDMVGMESAESADDLTLDVDGMGKYVLTEGNTGSWSISYVQAIPEPSAFGLLAGLGALALVGTRRRRK